MRTVCLDCFYCGYHNPSKVETKNKCSIGSGNIAGGHLLKVSSSPITCRQALPVMFDRKSLPNNVHAQEADGLS
jgi:hypothetical protein